MADQVPEGLKQERWRRLMERQAQVVRRKNLALVGSEQEVLGCGTDVQGRLWGRTQGQAPEIDGITLLDSTRTEGGEFMTARITGASGYDLHAREIA
jgi:ribosomal protein S12 methylthiotransferase